MDSEGILFIREKIAFLYKKVKLITPRDMSKLRGVINFEIL